MAEDILFVDKTGKEVFLPEKAGEGMGFKRSKNYTPPEVAADVNTGAESKSTEPQFPLSDAVDLVIRYLKDEDPNQEVKAHINRLADAMSITTASPTASLSSIRPALEAAIDGDAKISKTAKERILIHFDELSASEQPAAVNPDADVPGTPAITGDTDPETCAPIEHGQSAPAGDAVETDGKVQGDPVSGGSDQDTTDPKEADQPGKAGSK